MVKVMIDLTEENNKKVKQFMVDNDGISNKSDAVNRILGGKE